MWSTTSSKIKPTLVSGVKIINVRENREEQSRMDKPETLATLDT
jgi:hypothetical protein